MPWQFQHITLIDKDEEALIEAKDALLGEIRDQFDIGKSKRCNGGSTVIGEDEITKVHTRVADTSDFRIIEAVALELSTGEKAKDLQSVDKDRSVSSIDVGSSSRDSTSTKASALGAPSLLLHCDPEPRYSLSERVDASSPFLSFVDSDPSETERCMRGSYLSAAHTAHAFLPHMLSAAPSLSTFVFVSFLPGGNSAPLGGGVATSTARAAVLNLAEALAAELPREVAVQVAYLPPDFDDYRNVEYICHKLVNCALSISPRFIVTFGVKGWLYGVSAGSITSPVYTLLDAVFQVLLLGPLRLVGMWLLDTERQRIRLRSKEELGNECEENSANDEGGTIKGEWLCGGAGW